MFLFDDIASATLPWHVTNAAIYHHNDLKKKIEEHEFIRD